MYISLYICIYICIYLYIYICIYILIANQILRGTAGPSPGSFAPLLLLVLWPPWALSGRPWALNGPPWALNIAFQLPWAIAI